MTEAYKTNPVLNEGLVLVSPTCAGFDMFGSEINFIALSKRSFFPKLGANLIEFEAKNTLRFFL